MGNPVNKVLFINSEIMPFLPESPIAKIGRYLPQGIQDKKRQIRGHSCPDTVVSTRERTSCTRSSASPE